MARKKKEAYVVIRGLRTGIFYSWDECEPLVIGYPGAEYYGYYTKKEAVKVWEEHLARIQRLASCPAPIPGNMPLRLQSPNYQQIFGNDEQGKKLSCKRPLDIIDLTRSDDEESLPPAKRQHYEDHGLTEDEVIENEANIVLTPEQEAVVDLALSRQNIFLTGAGGCGKTVTLKRILARLKSKKIKYQVVAPTGIAALPLNGKTAYSFLGWNPDSFRIPLKDLLEKPKLYIVKAIKAVRVLIIEEISMVENQFLERMDMFLQSVLDSHLPFGGLQVIFLGDFHQLPPVKPFEFCLECGGMMSKPKHPDFVFSCETCRGSGPGAVFTEGDKWAFKASVWKKLNLRHVQLQRIHRQKEGQFQDILFKIRNDIYLTPEEWAVLERRKNLPEGICSVRLMSLRRRVDEINTEELAYLQSQPRSWVAIDSHKKVQPFPPEDPSRPWETDKPLKNHRFPELLTLKVGAKVVLLHNLDQKKGLVNGSQGVVVGFQKREGADCTPEIRHTPGLKKKAPGGRKTDYETFSAPVVKFSNGITRPIDAIESTSRYGTNQRPYLATRVQIPLALAWALTIHKSQGMTLEFIEVSSKDIFERGQFYVALSRGTNIEGVTVTGFSREQLPVDSDVLEFYETTQWESFATP